MKISRKLLYLVSFTGLAALSALAVARIGQPSLAAPLFWTVVIASLAASPGLIHRRAWPAALLLLPAGAYLMMRVQLPLPASVHGVGAQVSFYLSQLRSGAHVYATHRFPLDLTSAGDLKLLLLVCVYSATGLAAFVALSLRRALPAIVIALIPLGFGLTVDSDSRVIWLPLVFVLLAGCVLMLSRSLERERWRFADALTGATTALIATLLALSLLGVTSVSASKPWGNWRAWGPSGDTVSSLSVDWMANFASLLDPHANALVMRVKSPVGTYWRANALDYFSGTAWLSTWSSSELLQADYVGGTYSYAVPAAGPGATRQDGDRGVRRPGPVQQLLLHRRRPHAAGRGHAGPALQQRSPGAEAPPATRAEVHLHAHRGDPPIEARGPGRPRPRLPVRHDPLSDPALPQGGRPDRAGSASRTWSAKMSDTPADREWLGLYALNQSIVGSATDPYEIALRIEQYLRSNYTYSLKPPATDYESPYAAFLFKTKLGYCQHFAGAMAALLRFNGIPARVAVGFTSGQQSGGTFDVTRNNAHAWVEAYFPEVGWTPFDPTPGHSVPGVGTSSSATGFVNPFLEIGRGDAAGAAGQPAQARPRNPASGRADQLPVGGGSSSAIPAWLAWLLVPAVLLIGWPMGRVTLRRAALRRGSPEKRLRAAVAQVYAELRAYGVDAPRSRTLQETARYLERDLDLDATSLACRVESVLYGGRPATRQDLADLAELRRRLQRRLRARKGWARALVAAYGLAGVVH